jgi:hypothetical protein
VSCACLVCLAGGTELSVPFRLPRAAFSEQTHARRELVRRLWFGAHAGAALIVVWLWRGHHSVSPLRAVFGESSPSR